MRKRCNCRGHSFGRRAALKKHELNQEQSHDKHATDHQQDWQMIFLRTCHQLFCFPLEVDVGPVFPAVLPEEVAAPAVPDGTNVVKIRPVIVTLNGGD